jgi:hypothetical protein
MGYLQILQQFILVQTKKLNIYFLHLVKMEAGGFERKGGRYTVYPTGVLDMSHWNKYKTSRVIKIITGLQHESANM